MAAKIVRCNWCGKRLPENNPVHTCNRSDVDKIYPALPAMLKIRGKVIVDRDDLEMLRSMVCEHAPEGAACMDSFGPYPPCGQNRTCNSCLAREIADKYLLALEEQEGRGVAQW